MTQSVNVPGWLSFNTALFVDSIFYQRPKPNREIGSTDVASKSSILHGMLRRLGAGGADITLNDWLQFVQAQNDDYRTGPAIGEKVAHFALTDQHGQTRSVIEMMGPNGLLLVFSRSADW